MLAFVCIKCIATNVVVLTPPWLMNINTTSTFFVVSIVNPNICAIYCAEIILINVEGLVGFISIFCLIIFVLLLLLLRALVQKAF